ncbi:MAG TPA: SRPBCC domain-containing protein, partial [Bradyrhizobium sp.]
MSEIKTFVRAVSDLIDGQVVAPVDLATTPERVFQALASQDVVDWWVNPGVFDTREWSGDVRVGGRW